MSGARGGLRGALGTIRFRVAALAVLAVLLVLSVAGLGVVLAQRAILTDNLDEALARQAQAIADDLAAGRPIDPAAPDDDDVAILVVAPDGTVQAASPALSNAPAGTIPAPPGTGNPQVQTVDLGPEAGAARLLTRSEGGTAIYVAGSLDDVQESTRALVGSLLIAVPLSCAALAAVVWWSVGRTLRPVDDIRAQVEQISGARLDCRVPEPTTHDEIARLARTMNDMLDRLEAASENQRRFVADASHELRTPLARIRSELEVDLAHPSSADPAGTQRSMLAEAINLQRMVEDLLLLARIDATGPDGDRRELLDLDDELLTQASRVRSDALRIDARDVAPVQVVGDPSQIQRLLANLLDNAARHARTRIVLTLSRSPEGTAVLTVTDDGPGIPPERVDAAFQRFTRLDEARGREHGGAGLGLAIARDIAQRHGGTLVLDPGHRPGARFVLTLPASPG